MNGELLAMAGLAEAGIYLSIAIMGCGLFLIALIAYAALGFRSRWASLTAFFLLVLYSLYFEPWRTFTPFAGADFEDPDYETWTPRIQRIGIFWVLTMLLVISSNISAWLGRKSETLSADSILRS